MRVAEPVGAPGAAPIEIGPAPVGGAPVSIVGVRHIWKSFGPIAALKDVSLDIGAGEIRGICGENGAGKSTLVKILTGVYRPDEGTVLIGGRDISRLPPHRRARLWRRAAGPTPTSSPARSTAR